MKISKEAVLFFKSTTAVLFISTLIALATFLLNGHYIAAFILAASIQYILFTLIGNIVNNYYIQKTRQKELDKLESLSSLLACAYCQAPNVITFIPDQNERIEFDCDQCAGKNVVTIGFTVARITEPVLQKQPSLPLPPDIEN
jgi:hypothetical protein